VFGAAFFPLQNGPFESPSSKFSKGDPCLSTLTQICLPKNRTCTK
jgi:hypothetical protein